MADYTDIVEGIDSRLESLNQQIEKLEAAKQALSVTNEQSEPSEPATRKRGPGRPRKNADEDAPVRAKKTQRKRGRPAKREGYSRADKILDLTDKGMTPRQVADKLGTSLGYVYLVRRNAVEEAA